MSLYSNVTVTPNKVCAVIHYLLERRGCEALRDDLTAAVSPRIGTDSNDAQIKECIAECLAMGVVREEGERILLDDNVRSQFRQKSYDPAITRDVLTGLVCRSQDDACRGVAWLLGQEPLQPLSHHWAERAMASAGCAEYLKLTSSAAYNALGYWSHYLGWAVGRGQVQWVFDPTEHLARALPECFRGQDKKTGLPVREVLSRLASAWPVYPGGRYWCDIESYLPARGDEALPMSIAVALLRLQARRLLAMASFSDAPATMSIATEKCTHLRWLIAQGGRLR